MKDINVEVSTVDPAEIWSSVTSQSFGYTAFDDLRTMTTTVDVDGASHREDWTFDHDLQHQLVGATGPIYDALFTYTPGGRMSTVFVDGPDTAGLDRDVTYRYATTGDPELLEALDGPSGPTAAFSWDLAGNQVTKSTDSDAWTYRYDGADDLRSARHSQPAPSSSPDGTDREIYWYDPAGERMLALSLAGDQPLRLRLWFGGTEIHYDAASAVTRTEAHVSAGGVSLARIVDRTTAERTAHNHLGHLLAASDDHGRAIAGFTYSPFGELLRTLGSEASTFRRRFNGKESDALTGLSYYGARYYDPDTLTWTQADPLYRFAPDFAGDEPRRAALYTFSLNNPLRYLDPNGLSPSWMTRGGCQMTPSLCGRAVSAGIAKIGKETARAAAPVLRVIAIVVPHPAVRIAANTAANLIDLALSDETPFEALMRGEVAGHPGGAGGNIPGRGPRSASASGTAPSGSQAAGRRDETLGRLGTSRESASRLERKAAEAEAKIGIHGVSTTAGTPTGQASRAARSDVEQVFKVHDTPTGNDPLHRTVELPKPVTKSVADLFNRIFGRE